MRTGETIVVCLDGGVAVMPKREYDRLFLSAVHMLEPLGPKPSVKERKRFSDMFYLTIETFATEWRDMHETA